MVVSRTFIDLEQSMDLRADEKQIAMIYGYARKQICHYATSANHSSLRVQTPGPTTRTPPIKPGRCGATNRRVMQCKRRCFKYDSQNYPDCETQTASSIVVTSPPRIVTVMDDDSLPGGPILGLRVVIASPVSAPASLAPHITRLGRRLWRIDIPIFVPVSVATRRRGRVCPPLSSILPLAIVRSTIRVARHTAGRTNMYVLRLRLQCRSGRWRRDYEYRWRSRWFDEDGRGCGRRYEEWRRLSWHSDHGDA